MPPGPRWLPPTSFRAFRARSTASGSASRSCPGVRLSDVAALLVACRGPGRAAAGWRGSLFRLGVRGAVVGGYHGAEFPEFAGVGAGGGLGEYGTLYDVDRGADLG
jgi:hypothetical protein